jgi:hypothetical protein
MWLVALYAFLAATLLLALGSLGVLGARARRPVAASLALFIPLWLVLNGAFAYGVHRTAYTLESHDAFCVSCHLHEEEFQRFHDQASSFALDLAGHHQRHGHEFTCITCHVGEGVAGRARVLFFAGMDTVDYTLGDFRRDLDGMKHPLGDATCTKCHAPSGLGGFHGLADHAGHTAGCLSCHPSHARVDEAFGFIAYRRWPPQTLAPCQGCHPALLG